MEMFLITVVVTKVNTFIKTDGILHLRPVQLTVCNFYLNFFEAWP